MAATMAVMVDTGVTPTSTDTTALGPPNIRLKTADDPTIDNANPIPIPSSGTKRSMWKHVYLKATAGTFTQVDNIRFYTDGGGFGTGITVNYGHASAVLPNRTGAAATDYVQATGTEGDDGDVITDHTHITTAVDIFTLTEGSPLSVSISESGNVIDAVGETSDYVVLQMEVTDAATAGDLANETITFKYDEI